MSDAWTELKALVAESEARAERAEAQLRACRCRERATHVDPVLESPAPPSFQTSTAKAGEGGAGVAPEAEPNASVARFKVGDHALYQGDEVVIEGVTDSPSGQFIDARWIAEDGLLYGSLGCFAGSLAPMPPKVADRPCVAPDWAALYLDLAQTLGMSYAPDTGPDAPAPHEKIVETIRELQHRERYYLERDYLSERCPKCLARNGDHIIGIDIVEPQCPPDVPVVVADSSGHGSVPWPDDAEPPADADAVVQRLCRLLSEAWTLHDPNGYSANDCFCGHGGFRNVGKESWRNSGLALVWVEKVVRAALAPKVAEFTSQEKK